MNHYARSFGGFVEVIFSVFTMLGFVWTLEEASVHATNSEFSWFVENCLAGSKILLLHDGEHLVHAEVLEVFDRQVASRD